MRRVLVPLLLLVSSAVAKNEPDRVFTVLKKWTDHGCWFQIADDTTLYTVVDIPSQIIGANCEQLFQLNTRWWGLLTQYGEVKLCWENKKGKFDCRKQKIKAEEPVK